MSFSRVSPGKIGGGGSSPFTLQSLEPFEYLFIFQYFLFLIEGKTGPPVQPGRRGSVALRIPTARLRGSRRRGRRVILQLPHPLFLIETTGYMPGSAQRFFSILEKSSPVDPFQQILLFPAVLLFFFIKHAAFSRYVRAGRSGILSQRYGAIPPFFSRRGIVF